MHVLMLGYGKIGSQVAGKLIEAGCLITAVCKNEKQTTSPNVNFILGDLTNKQFVQTLPFADVDRLVIILTPNGRSEAAYHDAFVVTANLICTQLQQSCNNAGMPPALFVSSTAIYGQDDGSFCNEETLPIPTKFNGMLLLEAEQMYRNTLGDKLTIVRPSGIYGLGRTYMVRKARQLSEQVKTAHWTNRIYDVDLVNILTEFTLNDNPPKLCIATDNVPAKQADVLAYICKQLGLPKPKADKNVQNDTVSIMTGKRLVSLYLPTHLLSKPSYHSGYQSIIKNLKTCHDSAP